MGSGTEVVDVVFTSRASVAELAAAITELRWRSAVQGRLLRFGMRVCTPLSQRQFCDFRHLGIEEFISLEEQP
jgi:hypothetical protein